MKGCDHDVIYSGQTNLERKFAYICRRCGECGWDSRYVLAQVNFDEYCRQRVVHGWQSPPLALTWHSDASGATRIGHQLRRAAEVRSSYWYLLFFAAVIASCIIASYVLHSVGPLAGATPSVVYAGYTIWRLWAQRRTRRLT